jgi:Undecaprenyl-phosphate galactose phosphotransferase WbaP
MTSPDEDRNLSLTNAQAAAEQGTCVVHSERRAPPSAPAAWNPSAPALTTSGLLVADMIAMLTATIAVLGARYATFGAAPQPRLTLWFAILVWFGFRFFSGLYAPFGVYPPEKLKRSFASSLFAGVVHLALLAALTTMEPARIFNLVLWPAVLPLTYALRTVVRARLVANHEYGLPLVIIGNGPAARRAVRELLAHPDLGYVPIGVFSTEYAEPLERQNFSGVPVIGRAEQAPSYTFPYAVGNAMIVAGDGWHDERNHVLARRLAARYPSIQIFSSIIAHGHWLSRARPLGPYLVIETSHQRFSVPQRLLKRLLDISIALPAVFLTLPLMAVAAIAIYIADPGPILFSQVREGRHGSPIKISKLRTMVLGAEAKLASHLAREPAARFEYDRTMKLREDPRIIPGVGEFLRKSSLDEIPQLWSILIGDMSLVGPRIMPKSEIDLYSEEGQKLRREVSPGLTGFWQVEHRSDSDFKIREIADSFYVSNWSVWLDIWIILRTFKVVLTGSGAF